MNQVDAIDILILSNGPGEVTTWVRPVVSALRQRLGHDRRQVRISLVLSPCPNASGREVAIAQSYPEIDRVQGAEHFFPFLLSGKTAEQWDWRDRGVVLFLGGDQFFPVVIGKRLGYRTVIYGEWDTRWHQWIDRFGVMKAELRDRVSPRYADKFVVVGDLMAEAGSRGEGLGIRDWGLGIGDQGSGIGDRGVLRSASRAGIGNQGDKPLIIGLLPGSKPAKLAQGVPLTLAIAKHIHAARPNTRFVIPVAPTLDLATLAKFANPQQNSLIPIFENASAELVVDAEEAYLQTPEGLRVDLKTEFPAYGVLAQCQICLTTVGANTAELGSLAVPMIVLLPTQQLDAMRAWDGLPGVLANLPGLGTAFAKLINWWFLQKKRLLAWPNIWAGKEIVPELVGKLEPQTVAQLAVDWLDHPEQLEEVRDRLRSVRGEPGASQKLAQIVCEELAIATSSKF